MLSTLFVVIIAVLLDRQLGEPKRFHPLVGFGYLANHFEQRFNNFQDHNHKPFWLGLLGVILLCGGLAALLNLVSFTPFALLLEVIILYLAIGGRSLNEHAMAVHQALQDEDIDKARLRVSYMVSRHTEQMDESQISRAVIESTLENGNDALFGALFWFIVAGVPGVVFYRLVNTLDAMWGYRTERFELFGKTAAKLDDWLNYIPARLTAIGYALCGNFSSAIYCWKNQSSQLSSPNGGPVMSSGAGALQCQLGGPVIYHGVYTERPHFGYGQPAQGENIYHATQLIQRTLWLWLAVLTLITFMNLSGTPIHA